MWLCEWCIRKVTTGVAGAFLLEFSNYVIFKLAEKTYEGKVSNKRNMDIKDYPKNVEFTNQSLTL